jgi:hypothetical protein
VGSVIFVWLGVGCFVVQRAEHSDAGMATLGVVPTLYPLESCLRNWMAQADADEGKDTARLTSNELAELRKKSKRLEVENEILKRAAAYFARENVLPK